MTEFTVETPAFRQALATALEFASSDATLPPINVVHMAVAKGGGIEIVATDRYALSIETLKVDGEPFTATVPYDVAKRLLTLLPKLRRGQLLDSLVTFAQGDDKRVTVRVVGDFETALTFTPVEHAEPPLKFIDYRELVTKMTSDRKPPADLMAFNPRMLAKVCKVFAARSRSGAMRTSFSGHTKPVLIQQEDSDDDTLRVFLMPIRVHEYVKSEAAEVAA